MTKNCISPETVLKNVRAGLCHRQASGRTPYKLTYKVLLDGMVASGKIDQETAHQAIWEGAAAGRAWIVLAEVRKGNYVFPSTGTRRGRETYGQELLEHVAAGRISMKNAKAAIKEGNNERLAYLFDQMEYGWHDMRNEAGMTLQQELLKFIRLGLVSAREAGSAIRAGYRLRAEDALEKVRNGEQETPSESGLSCGEELVHLVRLGFVRQDDAHRALFAGHEKAMASRRKRADVVLAAVRGGAFAYPIGPCSDNTSTFCKKLKEFVAERLVDEEDADLALMAGRKYVIKECKKRLYNILDAVANGRSDLPSLSFLTFGQELQLLVESGAVSRKRVEAAERRGSEIKNRADSSSPQSQRDSETLP